MPSAPTGRSRHRRPPRPAAGARGVRVTFLLAFARPEFALLASDSRATMRPTPDAPASGWSDEGVKILPWGSGWLASGPSLTWRDAFVAGRDPLAALEAAMPPADAAIIGERQLTICVGADDGRTFRRAFDARMRERFPGSPHLAVGLCPNGSVPGVMRSLLDGYQRELTGAGLPEVLAATARLYAAVYAHCGPAGTVSPLLSIGLVDAKGSRELLGPFPHVAFLEEMRCAVALTS